MTNMTCRPVHPNRSNSTPVALSSSSFSASSPTMPNSVLGVTLRRPSSSSLKPASSLSSFSRSSSASSLSRRRDTGKERGLEILLSFCETDESEDEEGRLSARSSSRSKGKRTDRLSSGRSRSSRSDSWRDRYLAIAPSIFSYPSISTASFAAVATARSTRAGLASSGAASRRRQPPALLAIESKGLPRLGFIDDEGDLLEWDLVEPSTSSSGARNERRYHGITRRRPSNHHQFLHSRLSRTSLRLYLSYSESDLRVHLASTKLQKATDSRCLSVGAKSFAVSSPAGSDATIRPPSSSGFRPCSPPPFRRQGALDISPGSLHRTHHFSTSASSSFYSTYLDSANASPTFSPVISSSSLYQSTDDVGAIPVDASRTPRPPRMHRSTSSSSAARVAPLANTRRSQSTSSSSMASSSSNSTRNGGAGHSRRTCGGHHHHRAAKPSLSFTIGSSASSSAATSFSSALASSSFQGHHQGQPRRTTISTSPVLVPRSGSFRGGFMDNYGFQAKTPVVVTALPPPSSSSGTRRTASINSTCPSSTAARVTRSVGSLPVQRDDVFIARA